MAHAGHARVAEEQGPQRPAERGQRAERDQRVHRGRAVLRVGPGGTVEGQAAPDDDGRGEGEAQPLPEAELERRDHGEQDDGDGEHGGDDETLPQCGEGGVRFRVGVPDLRSGVLGFRFGLPGRAPAPVLSGSSVRTVGLVRVRVRVRVRAGGGGRGGTRRGGIGSCRRLTFRPGDGAGRVAGLLDRGDEVAQLQPVPEGDARLLGRVVHRGGDAVHPVELLLDTGSARGAGHPADHELGLGCVGCRETGCCCAGHVRNSWETQIGPYPTSIRWWGTGPTVNGTLLLRRPVLRRPGRGARTLPRRRRRGRRPRPAGPWT
ncbi:hypothetical protein EES46_24890 [Streptomyces sp. ADI98-10]|nr:hypothetical protein EES46_24890 [Streptomyces sp. ADI98-10]